MRVCLDSGFRAPEPRHGTLGGSGAVLRLCPLTQPTARAAHVRPCKPLDLPPRGAQEGSWGAVVPCPVCALDLGPPRNCVCSSFSASASAESLVSVSHPGNDGD